MSTNTFKVGDKVKILSTPRTEDLGIVVQKFTVDRVEPDTYTGPLDVRVSGADGMFFWLNHEDVELRGKKEKKPLKVGDKVIVKEVRNLFPAGTEGVVTRVIADSETPYKVEALGDFWFYTREQLKRVKKEKPVAAPVHKRDIKTELAAAWPWPEGTPVRFSESGDYSHLAEMTGLVLGSDDSRVPPVLDADGDWCRYVDVNDVELATEYQTWGEGSSRVVSALTEEQRTGSLSRSVAGVVMIHHSKDGEERANAYLYHEGDYRDNGDGTGTVLTLEEIFLNGLKK